MARTNSNGQLEIDLTKNYTILSTETKPINEIRDGDTLLEVDTGNVYVFHNGSWWIL